MPQPDDCAGDRRHRTLRQGRQLRLVLPLRRQRVAEQRQAQGPRQYQERQQVAGLGVCRGGELRGPLLTGGETLFPAKDGQDQPHCGDQGGGAQVGPGLFLHNAGRNAVRAEALLRLGGQVATASHERGWLKTTRSDWTPSQPPSARNGEVFRGPRPCREPPGAGPGATGSHVICDRANWTRHGTEGFLGHETRARGPGSPAIGGRPDALILMGDWRAVWPRSHETKKTRARETPGTEPNRATS